MLLNNRWYSAPPYQLIWIHSAPKYQLIPVHRAQPISRSWCSAYFSWCWTAWTAPTSCSWCPVLHLPADPGSDSGINKPLNPVLRLSADPKSKRNVDDKHIKRFARRFWKLKWHSKAIWIPCLRISKMNKILKGQLKTIKTYIPGSTHLGLSNHITFRPSLTTFMQF